jgi:glycosyltransferase involved in cell wall biosynthesis
MGQVVLYVHDFRSSGVVRNALALARRLAADHRTILVAGYGEGHFLAEASGGRLDIVALATSPGRLPRGAAAVRLRRWLATQPPHILLSVGNMGHPTSYWATRGYAHVRRIYRISTMIARGDGWRSRLRRAWMTMLVRDAAKVILVGEGNAVLPPFDRAVDQGRAIVIANGVDREAALERARAPVPHRWFDEPVPIVLGIGRLRPQKNFDRLIEAVAQARRVRRLRLILLGHGTAAERQRLTELAASAGYADDLLLAGETDNVFAWLARAQVFALPSLWEGSSMALHEALAVGVPVVAARQAGDAAHVLADGRYGLLVDGRDAGAIARALLIQTSPDAVRPGDRADDFGLGVDRYAEVIRSIEAGPEESARK